MFEITGTLQQDSVSKDVVQRVFVFFCIFWLVGWFFLWRYVCLPCYYVHILFDYFVVLCINKIIKHCFNWFWFYTVNRGITSRNIFLREKRFWRNLNISKQLFASGTMIYKSQNKREKSGTRSLEALKIRKTRQQKIQDRKDIEDIKDMKNWRGGTGKKRKQFELLGFKGTDKMARMDEDVNNRLFRREIRILTLLL